MYIKRGRGIEPDERRIQYGDVISSLFNVVCLSLPNSL